MGERFSDMEKAALVGKQASLGEIRPSEWDFLRRLREYPELKAKIETLLAIIENAGGDVEKAAEAERRIIEEMREMGNEVMHSWARQQQQKKEAEYQAKPGMNRKEKNLYGHTRLGKIEIAEQIFTPGRGGPEIRPFSPSAEVKGRECSAGLQRAMVDFGADHPFAGACTQLHEHYGIEVPVSAVRMTTLQHGAAMLAQENEQKPRHELRGAGVAVVIAEMDGSMLPVVETGESKPGETAPDRRKTRQVSWKEARLCLAHTPGSVTPAFGATLGSVEEAGERLAVCVGEAGGGNQTKIHGVGDGAVWITEQMEQQFGVQAQYLVDFYHLCDYLAAAAEAIAGPDKKSAWMEEKKNWLKENRWPKVLESLRPFLEESSVDAQAPVRACFRYISNRSSFLDYKSALAAGLPIGSGEIESAHRYIMQKRLKISGAWWKLENLSKMLALRVVRANQGWEQYWRSVQQEEAACAA